MAVKIIIVEDEALIAEEIKYSLETLGHQVVGHAMNGDNALDIFANSEADLVLLDINIRGTLDGIDLAKIIREKYKMPFVFLTSFSDKLTLEKATDTLPYGYIVKPFNEHDLKVNIALALSKFEAEEQSDDFSQAFVEAKLQVSFTEREFKLLEAFREGLTYKEAAKRLFISVNTVKTYQKRLFLLLNVSSKFELMEKVR